MNETNFTNARKILLKSYINNIRILLKRVPLTDTDISFYRNIKEIINIAQYCAVFIGKTSRCICKWGKTFAIYPWDNIHRYNK